MLRKYCFFLFLSLLCFVNIFGRTDLIIDNLYGNNGTEDALMYFKEIKYAKINKTTRAATVRVKFYTPMDNTVKITVRVWEWQGNEYRLTQFKLAQEQGFCDFTRTDKYFWDDILKHSNFPPKTVCPVPMGDYDVENLVYDPNLIPPIFKGKYMARCDFHSEKNGKTAFLATQFQVHLYPI